MPDIRHMDFSLDANLRKKVAEQCSRYAVEFCSAVRNPRVMRKLEEAFVMQVSNYADYALLGHDRDSAKYANEVEKLIDRAKDLSKRDAVKAQQERPLSQEDTYFLFNALWTPNREMKGDLTKLVRLGYLSKVRHGQKDDTRTVYRITAKGRDCLSPMTKLAATRPANFYSLPLQEQFEINRRLGIIGWESPTAITV